MNPVRQLHDRLGLLLVRALAPSTTIEGMPVYTIASKADRTRALERVAAGITLVVRHDPRRWARLLADVPGVIVWPLGSGAAGALNSTTRYCLLNVQIVLQDRSGLATAIVLAHEGMHARLLRRGVPHSRKVLARVEKVCKRAEWHLLARMPEFTNRAGILGQVERDVYAGRVRRAAV